jgi:hypothetical protein
MSPVSRSRSTAASWCARKRSKTCEEPYFAKPDRGFCLSLLQSEGVNVAGSHIAKHERCVGWIQPKPQAPGSCITEALQPDNELRFSACDWDSKDSRRITRIPEKVNEAAIARPRAVCEEAFIQRGPTLGLYIEEKEVG